MKRVLSDYFEEFGSQLQGVTSHGIAPTENTETQEIKSHGNTESDYKFVTVSQLNSTLTSTGHSALELIKILKNVIVEINDKISANGTDYERSLTHDENLSLAMWTVDLRDLVVEISEYPEDSIYPVSRSQRILSQLCDRYFGVFGKNLAMMMNTMAIPAGEVTRVKSAFQDQGKPMVDNSAYLNISVNDEEKNAQLKPSVVKTIEKPKLSFKAKMANKFQNIKKFFKSYPGRLVGGVFQDKWIIS